MMPALSFFTDSFSLFRLLLIGLVSGLVAASAAAYFVAPVDHEYTASITRVGLAGRIEVFQISESDDLLLHAATDVAPGAEQYTIKLPPNRAGLPVDFSFYKLRNVDDKVIGLASRAATEVGDDWLLYFAARGAMYLTEDRAVVESVEVLAQSADPDFALPGVAPVVAAGAIIDGSGTISGQTGRYVIRRIVGDDENRIEIETSIKQAPR